MGINAEYMGTHPIFESDFDCLTDFEFGSICQRSHVILCTNLSEKSSRAPKKSRENSWKPSNFKSPSRTTIHKKTNVSLVPSNCQTSQDQSNRFALLVMLLIMTKLNLKVSHTCLLMTSRSSTRTRNWSRSLPRSTMLSLLQNH